MNKIYEGQTIYVEHHGMYDGWPKGVKKTQRNLMAIDEPSVIRYGQVKEIKEDGTVKVHLTTEIGITGVEIPYKPKFPGFDDVYTIHPDNMVKLHFTTQEECQKYCDARNNVQCNNWLNTVPLDWKMKEKIDMWITTVQNKNESISNVLDDDFAKAVAGIPETSTQMEQ